MGNESVASLSGEHNFALSLTWSRPFLAMLKAGFTCDEPPKAARNERITPSYVSATLPGGYRHQPLRSQNATSNKGQAMAAAW